MKKIVLIFPGLNYGVLGPLLYYADFVFELKGFERKVIDYGNIINKNNLNDLEIKESITKSIIEQLNTIDFNEYQEIIFLSKSIGNVFASIVASKLKLKVFHIYLTPTNDTLKYIDDSNYIMITGSNDKLLDLNNLNDKYKNNTYIFLGADHSLEISKNLNKSLEVLKEYLGILQNLN